MDFGTLDTKTGGEEGATLHLMGPDDELLYTGEGEQRRPVTMTVRGTDSATWEKHVHRTNRKKKMKVSGDGVEIDTEETQRTMIDRMAECVISWDGIDYKGQSPFPCTKANAIVLFTDLPWLREKVYAFMQERSNFLGKA